MTGNPKSESDGRSCTMIECRKDVVRLKRVTAHGTEAERKRNRKKKPTSYMRKSRLNASITDPDQLNCVRKRPSNGTPEEALPSREDLVLLSSLCDHFALSMERWRQRSREGTAQQQLGYVRAQ